MSLSLSKRWDTEKFFDDFFYHFLEKIVLESDKSKYLSTLDLDSLVKRFDFTYRWVYRGSLVVLRRKGRHHAKRMCSGWNVVDDIQPISIKALKMYQMKNRDHHRGDMRCSHCSRSNRKVKPL